MRVALTACLLVLVSGTANLDAAVASESNSDSTIETIPAKQIRLSKPLFPQSQLKRRREAWVHLTYCIDEEGDIQNISVLESSGNSAFDKSAANAVQRFEFEPALRDGIPVWQSRNEVVIRFVISDAGLGASNNFIRRHREISELIDHQNLAEANQLFWDTYENFELTLYELGKLWAQRVRYEALVGDVHRLDMALHRATASHGAFIDADSYIRLLGLRAQVQLRLGKYHEALHSYNDLVEATSERHEQVLALTPTIGKLQAMIDDDSVWQISAEVRQRGDCAYCDDSWEFIPVRNRFTIANIAGRLESIDMRCDNKRVESTISDSVEWQIHDEWGTCHVQFYGDPGTTFNVVMLPGDDA